MGWVKKIVGEGQHGPLEWEQRVLKLLLMILPSVDLCISASDFPSWEWLDSVAVSSFLRSVPVFFGRSSWLSSHCSTVVWGSFFQLVHVAVPWSLGLSASL